MSDASITVQAAIVSVLESAPGIVDTVSGIYDGPPPRARFPYIAIAGGVATDWSTKTATGRELRVAVTVWDDGETPARIAALMAAVEAALPGMPRDLPGWRVASIGFLRSLITRDPAAPWAGLIEHRVRVLATP